MTRLAVVLVALVLGCAWAGGTVLAAWLQQISVALGG